MHIRKLIVGGCFIAALGLSAAPANASPVYSSVAPVTTGLSNYGFTTGSTFTVNSPGLYVDSLMLFDGTGGQFSTDVYVGLYNDTTGALVTSQDFKTLGTGAAAGTFVSDSIAAAFLINGDTYSIEEYPAVGTTLNIYVDSSGPSLITFNSLGGALTNVNSFNYNAENGFFSGTDSPVDANYRLHPVDFFGSASLDVRVPEPFTLSLFGAGLVGVGATRRRKKAVP